MSASEALNAHRLNLIGCNHVSLIFTYEDSYKMINKSMDQTQKTPAINKFAML